MELVLIIKPPSRAVGGGFTFTPGDQLWQKSPVDVFCWWRKLTQGRVEHVDCRLIYTTPPKTGTTHLLVIYNLSTRCQYFIIHNLSSIWEWCIVLKHCVFTYCYKCSPAVVFSLLSLLIHLIFWCSTLWAEVLIFFSLCCCFCCSWQIQPPGVSV